MRHLIKRIFILIFFFYNIFNQHLIFAAETPPAGFKALCLIERRTKKLLDSNVLNSINYRAPRTADNGGYECPTNYDPPGFYLVNEEVGLPEHKCPKESSGDKFWCVLSTTKGTKDGEGVTHCKTTLEPYLGCARIASIKTTASPLSTPTPRISETSTLSTPTPRTSVTSTHAAPAFKILCTKEDNFEDGIDLKWLGKTRDVRDGIMEINYRELTADERRQWTCADPSRTPRHYLVYEESGSATSACSAIGEVLWCLPQYDLITHPTAAEHKCKDEKYIKFGCATTAIAQSTSLPPTPEGPPTTAPLPVGAPRPEEFHAAVQYFFTLQGKSLDEALFQEKMKEYEKLAASKVVRDRAPLMTIFDFYAVYVYTTLAYAYQTMNNALRTNNTAQLQRIRPVISWLDHYLAHASRLGTFRPDGTRKLSRFVNFSVGSPEYRQYTIRTIITDAGYTSATANPGIMVTSGSPIVRNSTVHLLIRPLPYTESKGVPLFSSVTQFGSSENEVLFGRNTKFRVDQRTDPGQPSLCSAITGKKDKLCVEVSEVK